MSELTWCHRWSKWKAKGGTINLCEMLRVNLHVLRLLQNLMTALQMAYHENIKNITHKYFPLFVICQQEFFFCVNHLNNFFFFYVILFCFIITLGIHLQYSYTVLTYNKTTKFTYVTALLLTWTFSIIGFCITLRDPGLPWN